MRLKRLILQGFKSFKDKTVIHFDDGITGIVGPNGCGKSNIVDALFWVMGEMSAKHLRGNSMKDVIFAGSDKHSPASWAEVSLVLENEEQKFIHIGGKVSRPSEIQLTRKLYRNSETEYRINNQPARLKDIQEVFMDTGAGAKSYSIIAQGEINKIVQAKPIDRRSMIEEVAGITKFKMRRKESLRKIEATESNLSRIDDLKGEIYKNLKALEKQAEKAERAKVLKEKIKRNDLVVNSHKEFDLLKDFRDGKNILSEKKTEVETWSAQKQTLENSLEKERIIKLDLESNIDQLQSIYGEASKKLAAGEERLSHLQKSIIDKENQKKNKTREIEEITRDLKEREEKRLKVQGDFETLTESQKEAFDFEALEEEVNNLKEGMSDHQSTLEEQKLVLEDHKDTLRDKEQDFFKNNSKVEEFSKRLEEFNEEIELIETDYSKQSQELLSQRDEVLKLEADLSQYDILVEEKDHDIKKQREALAALKSNLDQATKQKIELESERKSHIEISKNLQLSNEGTQSFLEIHAGQGFETLGGLIECEEDYVKAVESILDDYFYSLVSKDDNLDLLINWSKENLGATLEMMLPKKHEAKDLSDTIARLEVNGLKDIVELKDIVKINQPEFSHKIEGLFEGHFLVGNLSEENFNSISSDIGFKSLVSLDGRILVKNDGDVKYLKRSSNAENQMGLVERNNFINKLGLEIEEIDKKHNELVSNHESLMADLEKNETEYDEHNRKYVELKTDYASKKSTFDQKKNSFDDKSSRLEMLKKRKGEISVSRLEIGENEEKFHKEIDLLKEAIENLENGIQDSSENYINIKAQYEEKNSFYLEKQVEANTWKERKHTFEEQLEDLQTQKEKLITRLDNSNNAIAVLVEELTQIESQISILESENIKSVDDLKAQESVLRTHKDDLAKLLLQMQGRETDVKKLSTSINKNEKSVVEYEMRLKQYLDEEELIVKNVFEKYHIDLRNEIASHLEYSEDEKKELNNIDAIFFFGEDDQTIPKEAYTFNRRYGQDLRNCSNKLKSYKTEINRLGEINWQAIEDYNRQKLRYDFLKEQEEELKKSLEDLKQAIEHIDTKSRTRFKEAFDEVNVRFEKVFPIIFGGGEARLQVVGDLDSPECGIEIIASPPGKKMQNINLMSGGEKALTAVSLIFSIFLVKPSPFCLLDEVDAPLDDANVGRFNDLLREMSDETQFILITHNKKTMELNDTLYGVTMQTPGISSAVSVRVQ